MIKIYLRLLFLSLLVVSDAYATKPCMPPDKQWFSDNVIKKSDLVIYAKVKDFSGFISNAFGSKWTEVEILQTLHGNQQNSNTLNIQDWQSFDLPFYSYKKGNYALFWLAEDNGKYRITDLNWDYCVPAVWDAYDNKTVDNLFTNERIILDEVKALIDVASE